MAPSKIFALAAAAMFPLANARLDKRQDVVVNREVWQEIEPSPEIVYHACNPDDVELEEEVYCARLLLPLDWSKANDSSASADSDGNSVALALMKVAAVVPHDDPSFGGTIMYNPGGPGGDSVGYVGLAIADIYRETLDTDDKHYEFVFFDPRGVGLSTPSALCHMTDADREDDMVQLTGFPSIEKDDDALAHHWQHAVAYGQLCAETDAENNILAHISTAAVARDMLSIAERVEDERQGNTNSSASAEGKPLVNFIGVSYGTFLGNTFASMFPDRVGRFLLDAVVDPDEFVEGVWLTALEDAEEILDYMYEQCFEADCELKRDGDSGPEDLKRRVYQLLEDLNERPAAFVHEGRVYMVSADDVGDYMQSTTYLPEYFWPEMGEALNRALEGNFSTIVIPADHRLSCENIDYTEEGDWPRPLYTWGRDAGYAIQCADSFPDEPRNISWAQDAAEALREQTFTVGRTLLRRAIACAGWQVKPGYAYRGPFGSPEPDENDPDSPNGNMLVTSARLDNITPLSSARKLAEAHGGASLVIQEDAVHGVSLFPSNCTAEIMRTYFATGVVPKDETVCEGVDWDDELLSADGGLPQLAARRPGFL